MQGSTAFPQDVLNLCGITKRPIWHILNGVIQRKEGLFSYLKEVEKDENMTSQIEY